MFRLALPVIVGALLTLAGLSSVSALVVDPGGGDNPGDPHNKVDAQTKINPYTNEDAHGPACLLTAGDFENSCEHAKAPGNRPLGAVTTPDSKPNPDGVELDFLVLGAWEGLQNSSSKSAVQGSNLFTDPTTDAAHDCAHQEPNEPEPASDCTGL